MVELKILQKHQPHNEELRREVEQFKKSKEGMEESCKCMVCLEVPAPPRKRPGMLPCD
jgi:hypothetical protein